MDAWIFLGKKNRTDFEGGLGVDGHGNRSDQVGDTGKKGKTTKIDGNLEVMWKFSVLETS